MNDQNNFDDDAEDIIYVSRSEMKRDMLELQALGEAIVKLSKGQLDTIPIEDETLAEAIHTARKIKHREGLRRQMQYIGKLMRKVDTQAMAAAYKKLQDGHKEKARQFHELEQWRDHLITSNHKSIEEVMQRYPEADRQYLRQLVIQANKDIKNKKPPTASRKLFRYLRELSGF